ncbi:unnamed protein product, partial [Prorocentrum cordatum]
AAIVIVLVRQLLMQLPDPRGAPGGAKHRLEEDATGPLFDNGFEAPSDKERLEALVKLLGQSGDTEGAAKYQKQLDEYRRSQQEASIAVGAATQRVKQSEAGLRRAVERFDRAEKQYNEAQSEVAAASAEVDLAQSIYIAAVKRFVAAADEQAAKPEHNAVPTIDLASLLEGQVFCLDDGGLLGLDELGGVATDDDEKEAQRRKDEPQKQFAEAAKACFGDLKAKAAATKEEQAKQKERLNAKRPRPNAEGDADQTKPQGDSGATPGQASDSGGGKAPPTSKAPPGKAAPAAAPPATRAGPRGAAPSAAAAAAGEKIPSVGRDAKEKLAQSAASAAASK